MKARAAIVLFLLLFNFGAIAKTAQYNTGVVTLEVADPAPFRVFIWYPTMAANSGGVASAYPHSFAYPISATLDAPVATGSRFPILLFSHGGGSTGGNPLLLRDLAAHLARTGLIVVMPAHGSLDHSLIKRPRQIHAALAAMLADPRFAAAAYPKRVGMIGFSLGGGIALLVAGAKPDLTHLSAYCQEHPEDHGACDGAPKNVSEEDNVAVTFLIAPSVLRIKALVLLDPFGAMFTKAGLDSLRVPVMIFRPEHQDVARADGNALALATGLPRSPELEVIPGGHFTFLDECPPSLLSEVAECRDPYGIDRAAIHARIEMEISAFLHRNL